MFDWQNLFLELAAHGLLEGDGERASEWHAAAMALARSPALGRLAEREETCGFLLTGLAAGLDAFAGSLRRQARCDIARLVSTLAEALDGRRAEPWGEFSPARNAWNHSVVAYAGLGAAGLVLDHPRAPEWRRLALAKAQGFFADGVSAAGATREGLFYAGFVFRNLGIFLRMARTAGLFDYTAPTNPHLDRLRRIPDWYRAAVFPRGGWLECLNSSYWNPHPALKGFLLTFRDIAPAQTAAVWNRTLGDAGTGSFGITRALRHSSVFETLLFPAGEEAGAVEPTTLHCPDAGIVVAGGRNGLSDRVTVTCGEPMRGLHSQADNGHFTLFLDGVPIAIDNGTRAEGAGEGASRSTTGHNLVLVNGGGQHRRSASMPARMERFENADDRLVLHLDLTGSYADRKPRLSTRAGRGLVWLKDLPGLLVVDDFCCGTKPAAYRFVCHCPQLERSVAPSDRFIAKARLGEGEATFAMIFSEAPHALDIRTFDSANAPFSDHPMVTADWFGDGLRVATLLVPGRLEPGLTVRFAVEPETMEVSVYRRDELYVRQLFARVAGSGLDGP